MAQSAIERPPWEDYQKTDDRPPWEDYSTPVAVEEKPEPLPLKKRTLGDVYRDTALAIGDLDQRVFGNPEDLKLVPMSELGAASPSVRILGSAPTREQVQKQADFFDRMDTLRRTFEKSRRETVGKVADVAAEYTAPAYGGEPSVRLSSRQPYPSSGEDGLLKRSETGRVKEMLGGPTAQQRIEQIEREGMPVIPPELSPQLLTAYKDAALEAAPPKNLVEKLPFIGGVASALRLNEVVDAAKNIESGNGTELDHAIMGQFAAQVERDQGKGFWAGVGDILSMLPGFMVEFAATGGAYTAAKGSTEAALKKGAISWIASRAAGVAAQTAANPQRVMEAKARRDLQNHTLNKDERGLIEVIRTADDEGFAQAWSNAFADTMVELGSERTGSLLESVPAMRKLKEGFARAFIARGGTAEKMLEMLKKGGWNGALGEMMEERVGEAARAGLGLQDYQVPSPKQLLQEAVAFSVLPGATVGVGAIMDTKEKPPGEEGESPAVQAAKAKAGMEQAANEADANASPQTAQVLREKASNMGFEGYLKETGRTPEDYRAASESFEDVVPLPEGYQNAVAVSPSPIEGQGIFTVEAKAKGESVAPAFVYEDGIKRTIAGRFVNHADAEAANTTLEIRDGVAMIVAKVPLKAGEELTFDYREHLPAVKQLTIEGEQNALHQSSGGVLSDVPEQPGESQGEVPAPGRTGQAVEARPTDDTLTETIESELQAEDPLIQQVKNLGVAIQGLQDALTKQQIAPKKPAPSAATQQAKSVAAAIPLGVERPPVRDKALELMSDAEFDAAQAKATQAVDALEKARASGQEVDLNQLAQAQDTFSSVDLERYRRNVRNTAPADLFDELRGIGSAAKAPESTAAQQAQILLEELQRQGATREHILSQVRLSSPDAAEVFKGQLQDIAKVAKTVAQPAPQPQEASPAEVAFPSVPPAAKAATVKESVTVDPIDDALTKAIEATRVDPTKLQEGVSGAPVWMTKAALNGTLRVIRAAYRGGRKLAQAINEGIEWLRARGLVGFDEAEARTFFESAMGYQPYVKGRLGRVASRIIHGSALPKEWRDTQIWGRNMRTFIEEKLRLSVEDAKAALEAEFKSEADRDAAKERLSAYWNGEADLATVGGPALQRSAKAVREYIDNLSRLAVRNGLVSDSMAQTWLDNLGTWMRRTYMAFDPQASWNYDTLKAKRDKGDKEITRIWNNAERYLRAQMPDATDAEIEGAMRTLVDRVEVESIIKTGTLPGSSGRRFAVDITSLLRRKDIAPELREWMGEIKDPFARAMLSSKWMAQFIARNLTQRRMARIGLELGLLKEISKPEGRFITELYPNESDLVQVKDPETGEPLTDAEGRPIAEHRTRIDRRYEPLHGLYTTPELAAALDEQNASIASTMGLSGADILVRAYGKGVGLVKQSLVGLNPYAWPVNIIGGALMRLAAGGWNPIYMKRAMNAVLDGEKPVGAVVDTEETTRKLRARADYLAATKQGLTGQGIMYEDVQQHFAGDPHGKSGTKMLKSLKEIFDKNPKAYGALARSIGELMGKPGDMFIRRPDDIFRLSAFFDELALAKAAYPDWTEARQAEWAADRASNIYQTYDRVLPILRSLSRGGVLGTFVTFKFELMRNIWWIAKYAKEGLMSDNPALRRDGAQKAAGLIGAMAAPLFVSALSKAISGVGDDDEEALKRSVIPPWDKKEDLIIVNRDGTVWTYAPTSYLLPHSEMTSVVRSGWKAANSENPQEDFKQLAGAMAADYLGPGAFLGPALEAGFNFRIGSDSPITRREGMEGAKEQAAYLVKAWRPKLGDPVIDYFKGMKGDQGEWGKTFSPNDPFWRLAAVRTRTVDVKQQMTYKMREQAERWRNAASEKTKAKRKFPSDEAKQQEGADYAKRVQADIKKDYDQMRADWKKLGVSAAQIRRAEKDLAIPVDLRK